MYGLSLISACSLVFLSSLPSIASATSLSRHSISQLRQYYTRYHSLGNGYQFDPREWENVNVTDLTYKYDPPVISKRGPRVKSGTGKAAGAIPHFISTLWNGLKGIGNPQEVKITWYTGHDLENPSCWANPSWAPTDDSFACALTLQGWTTQPKCFKFLELCNGPQKCVFVRVVDSCAGCAPGSKHVDLTKGAFSQLANPDEGVLNVQMRQATDPDRWFEDLWGPIH